MSNRFLDPTSRTPREWFTVAAIAIGLALIFLVIRLLGSGGAWLLPAALAVIGAVNLVQGIRAKKLK
mgnify:CR=1